MGRVEPSKKSPSLSFCRELALERLSLVIKTLLKTEFRHEVPAALLPDLVAQPTAAWPSARAPQLPALPLPPVPAHLPVYSLCRQSPSVQFLESSSTPLQSLPPLRGAGAAHSRLRQWVHSVLHADHLLHSVQAPSTVGHQTQARRHPPWHTFRGSCPSAGMSLAAESSPCPSQGSQSVISANPALLCLCRHWGLD